MPGPVDTAKSITKKRKRKHGAKRAENEDAAKPVEASQPFSDPKKEQERCLAQGFSGKVDQEAQSQPFAQRR